MVAKIVIGKNIRGILHYNENKVAAGEASLIVASGFAGEIDRMDFKNKLRRFEHLIDLKPSVKTNALHISLNFDSAEKLGSTKMQQIAIVYMDRIGFSEQPFLVYRHNDAAHQHLHIVTTSIQRSGESINLHNIGKTLSEPARKSIEIEFGLMIAESRKQKQEPAIKPAELQKASYGRIPTKRAISNVVTAVMNTYCFTSLAEYNAVLKQFNVTAERGEEESEMFQKKGLIYFLLDSNGDKIGVPIKASAFYSKPTLHNLEKKFEKNEEKRKPFRQILINSIDLVLKRYERISQSTLIAELRKEGVHLALRQNEKGFIYGATFIDNKNKAVFNGSDLGKSFSAKALTERFSTSDQLKTYLKPLPTERHYPNKAESTKHYLEPVSQTNFLEGLLGRSSSDQGPALPKRKKRPKRGLNFKL